MTYELKVKRIYEPASPDDGRRFLIDRLWPRGVSKERAAAEWTKELAPSPALREWFGHAPERFEAFTASYRKELDANPAAAAFAESCRETLRERNVTLLYASKEENCCNAPVLRDWIAERLTN